MRTIGWDSFEPTSNILIRYVLCDFHMTPEDFLKHHRMNRRSRFFLFIRKRAWRCFFVFLALVASTLIVLSMLSVGDLRPSEGAVIFGGLLAFAIVWWQGYLIKEQMQLQALIELDKEWNSTEMLRKRHEAWAADTVSVVKDKIEPVLEFLEKVSTLEKRNVVAAELIWDTFG